MHPTPPITKRPPTPLAVAPRLPAALSHPRNLAPACIHGALIVTPLKPQTAGLRRYGIESEVGIGGDGRMPVRSKDLLAVIGARECVDDVAWNEPAIHITVMAAVHRMGDQRFNLDDLPLLGRAGDA